MEKKKVLIVDDSPYIQKSLAKILEAHHCEVVGTASNGLEAVRMFNELRPDFVTLDLIMPQMGGVQTLQLLKRIAPEVKVIMVSSMAEKEKIIECARFGASHYILKPFDEDAVVETLRKVIFAEPV